jgi:hypothetical protein
LAKGLSRRELLSFARSGAEQRIQELRAELAKLEAAFGRGRRGSRAIGTWPVPEKPAGKPRKRRKMSAAGRAKIAAAARARWAKWRKEKGKK